MEFLVMVKGLLIVVFVYKLPPAGSEFQTPTASIDLFTCTRGLIQVSLRLFQAVGVR
jgi:hypothetical protein